MILMYLSKEKVVTIQCKLIDYEERKTINKDPFISMKVLEGNDMRTVSVFFNGDNGTLYEVFKEVLNMAKNAELVSKELIMLVTKNYDFPGYYKCPLTFRHNNYNEIADIDSTNMELHFFYKDYKRAAIFKILNQSKDNARLLKSKLADIIERSYINYNNKLKSDITKWNDPFNIQNWNNLRRDEK